MENNPVINTPSFKKQQIYNPLLLIGFSIIFLNLVAHSFAYNLMEGMNNWVLTDLLINYSGGFIRRGLAGTALHTLVTKYDLDTYSLVVIINHATYCLVVLLYILKIVRISSFVDGFSMALMLFLPSLLLFPLLDYDSMGRKEILFFLPLAINLFLLQGFADRSFGTGNRRTLPSKSHILRYLIYNFFFYNLLAVPMALTHESILFLSVPVNFAITFNIASLQYARRKSILTTALVYMPTLLAIMTCFYWHGNSDTALTICMSWQSINVLDCSEGLPAALGALTWTLRQGLSLPYHIVTSGNVQILLLWLFLFTLNLLFLVIASHRIISRILHFNNEQTMRQPAVANRIVQSFLFSYLALPLLASAPLYTLGLDWGRWFFSVLVGFGFCSLTPGLVKLKALSHTNKINCREKPPNRIENLVYRGYDVVLRFLKQNRYIVGAVAIYVIAFTKLPHCCIKSMHLYFGLIEKIMTIINLFGIGD